MTSVVTRWLGTPDRRTRADAEPPSGAGAGLLTGALAGAGAAAAGLVILAAVIGLAWIVEPAIGGSVLGPGRLSVQAWLVGHGADVAAGGVRVAITPLGLSALLAICCWYAAGWAGRRSQVDSLTGLARVLGGLVVSYTALGLGLVLIGATSGAEIGFGSAVPGIVALSGVVGAGGLLRTAGHGRLLHDLAPFPSRAVLSGAGAGGLVLAAAGVGTVGISVAVDRAGFATLTESLAPSLSAGLGLFVLSVLLLPNAALYAVAVLLGPGFAVGAGTTVSAFGVTLGLVPGLPLVAALPDRPAVPLGALLGLAVPLLCGLVVGVVVARRLDDDVGALHAAGWAVAAGLLLAVGIGLAQSLAGGALGSDGLATIGAPPVATALLAAGVLAPPAGLSAAVLRRRHLSRRR
ncbi:MAG: cell division protein PerM [Geodermatophilaceae bacterium]